MKTHWKTLIYAILGNFMIAVINFLILTKPFLAEGKSQYTIITVPLNALILLVFGIGIGKILATHNQYTTPSEIYRESMSLKDFIWIRHGFKLAIVLALWLICLLNPKIMYHLSDLLALSPPYDVSLSNPYTVSVWKQFIIYYVTSIPSITAWVMCYIAFVLQEDKLQFQYDKKTLGGL